MYDQGGRTWQPLVGGKNGHENFRQARFYNFRDKCVIFARNHKFANLTQKNMQKVHKLRQILIRDKIAKVWA